MCLPVCAGRRAIPTYESPAKVHRFGIVQKAGDIGEAKGGVCQVSAGENISYLIENGTKTGGFSDQPAPEGALGDMQLFGHFGNR